jgi:deaminated glutathione amidase
VMSVYSLKVIPAIFLLRTVADLYFKTVIKPVVDSLLT